jgi:hypothetical protein
MIERNVISDPLSKSARLIYKHPKAPDGVEAAVVYLAEEGMPDTNAGLMTIQKIARTIYGPRTMSPPAPVRDIPEGQLFSPRYRVEEQATPADMAEVSSRSFPEGFSR